MYPPMFLGVAQWAAENPSLTANEQSALLALAWHFNASTKVAEPSRDTIRAKSHLGKDALRTALKGLTSKGVIKITERPVTSGRNQTNLYTLLADISSFDLGSETRPHWGPKPEGEIPVVSCLDNKTKDNRYLGVGNPTPPPTDILPHTAEVIDTPLLSSDNEMWIDTLATKLSYELADHLIETGQKNKKYRNDAATWQVEMALLLKDHLPLAHSLLGSNDPQRLSELFTDAVALSPQYVNYEASNKACTPVRLLGYQIERILGAVAPSPTLAPVEPVEDGWATFANTEESKARMRQALEELQKASALTVN
jgi:hypothetical protein